MFHPSLIVAFALWPLKSFAADAVVVAPNVRQLFLDDYGVAKMTGMSRTMHRPTKRGPVLLPDAPSDGILIEVRSAPLWDEDQQLYKDPRSKPLQNSE